MFTTDALDAAMAGRYTIERLVGEGGMARVYLARDLRHNRRVALKVLRPDLGAVVGVDRFQAEIQVTANLQHPNLLPLFDSGAAGEMLFYVMPYVDGESLRARLDREKQLPVDEAIRIATAIAAALDYAHRQGVVHRDLKPENVLIQEGQPLVADFGIALAVSKAGGARITQTGLSLGTPQYMSPEQATGDRMVDGRTDIYSLGALTYEMLTGDPPHTGSTSQAVIARVLTEKPRSIRTTRPSVPEYVEAAVDRALEKLPADRWATAHEFAEALAGARQIARSTSAVSGPRAVAPRPRARAIREAVAWTLVVGLVAVAASLGVRVARPLAAPPSVEFEIEQPQEIDLASGGSAASIALSRDGRTLVFVGKRVGARSMLYSRRIGQRLVQEIRGTEEARSPVFSPDGKEVVFAVFGTGAATIKRIDVTGGVARTITDSGPRNGQLSWRDGNQVVMALENGGLVLLNVDDGHKTLLARPDTARGHLRYGFPNVLPGGKAALIVIWKKERALDSAVIGTVSIPTGKVTALDIRGFFPRYSETGHIVYAAAAATQPLYAVPFDARTLRVTGTASLVEEGVGGGTGGAVPLAVSDNGTLAFIQNRFNGAQVTPVIVSRTGVKRFFGAAPGLYRNPRISPDGRQIAYATSVSRGSGPRLNSPDIWRLDVSTGKAQRVTSNGSSDRPIWSHDGGEIFFSRVPGDSIEYAVSLAADAQPRAVFYGPGSLGTSDIGPAHGNAVFEVPGPTGSSVLWVAPLDSPQKARVFAAQPNSQALPRISPDGRFVAYQSGRVGTSQVYVRSILGKADAIQVSSDQGSDPAWSPDGRELYYRSLTSGGLKGQMMMVAHVATSPKLAVTGVRPLFPLNDYYTSARTVYDVFPNGDFLLFDVPPDTAQARGALVVRLNWLSAIEERAAERKR